MVNCVTMANGDDLGTSVVLATGSYDHTIRLWHPATAMCIHTMQHSESQTNALEVTQDCSLLAAAGYQTISMYDLKARSATPVLKFDQISKNVTAVGFNSYDNRWMYSGGEDCSARIWDLRVGSGGKIQCQRIFQVSTPVNCVCLHPNQTELFFGDASGTIHLWDLRTDHNEQLLPEPNAVITSLDVDSEGTMLAAVNNKGVAYVWSLVNQHTWSAPASVPTQQELQTSTDEPKQNSPSQSDPGAGDINKTTLVPKIKVPKVHSAYALKCKFSPDSTLLATTSADQTARLWRTADFSETAMFQVKDQKWVWDCAFTADSQSLFTCSSDGMLRLWSAQGTATEPLKTYSGHQKSVTAMALCEGGGICQSYA